MLHLAEPTDSSWGAQVLPHLDEILLDHAHCEKKAASTALNLIFRYPHVPQLMVPLSRLAREELAHFEQVLQHIRRRGREYRRQKPSPYAGELMALVRTYEPLRLADTLLCCALIEARSCERMQLLADALARAYGNDDPLVGLYRGLLACEARHHRSYVDLARDLGVMSKVELENRLRELATREAQIVARPTRSPRLHAGIPVPTGRLTRDHGPAAQEPKVELEP